MSQHSDSDSDVEVSTENELTPQNVTKYQTAGDIANRSLALVLAALVPGVTVGQMCALGNESIKKIAGTVYNKGKVPKGIAFPTCVSVNAIACHLCPLESDPEHKLELKAGDCVRVEMGAHVDGYIAHVCTTVVVGAEKSKPTTGKKADLINACNLASEAAIRLVKPGNTNTQVTEALDTIAKEFGCVAVQSMTSHQLLRNVHDGPNQIVQNPTEDSKIATVTFEQGQVYAINVMLSSGAGKVKPSTTRTTVYKRNPDAKYQLKMKASRAVFSQIQKECGTMAFCLSQLEDEKLARMGIIECQTHGLVSDYKVLHEEAGTDVAQFGFTVLLMPNGPLKIAQYPFAADMFVSEISLKDEVLSKLIAEPIRKTKKKKN